MDKDTAEIPFNQTIGATLTQFARKAVGTEIETIVRDRAGDVPVLIVDKGRELIQTKAIIDAFEATQTSPYRRRGTYRSANIASLLAWMAAHCAEDAPVFGVGAERIAEQWAEPKLALVGIANYSKGAAAEWHDLQVRYDFPVTLAWVAWCKNHKDWMKQGEFAEFIEARLYEISEPKRGEDLGEAVTRMIEALGGSKTVGSPNDIYALSTGVKINVAEKVEVQLDRNTGEQVMRYTEEHTGQGGRPVRIPKFFYIRVPVFFGEEPALIGVILRYRNVGGGSVMWGYELFAPDLVVQQAFDAACDVVKTAQRTLYLGTPD